jgi:hypothetical protein
MRANGQRARPVATSHQMVTDRGPSFTELNSNLLIAGISDGRREPTAANGRAMDAREITGQATTHVRCISSARLLGRRVAAEDREVCGVPI